MKTALLIVLALVVTAPKPQRNGCFMVPDVMVVPHGFQALVDNTLVFIPQEKAQPSGDEYFWFCRSVFDWGFFAPRDFL